MAGNPVLAQLICAPRDAFVERLRNNHAETPVEQGLTNENGWLVELFASADGETWTLLLTFPNGESCLITAGHNWRAATPKLLKPTGLPI